MEQQPPTIPRETTDRRSMLKKAAVAGSIVWAAPVIHSTSASAMYCTPKCRPDRVPPNVIGCNYCAPKGSQFVKNAGLILSPGGSGTCPCDSQNPTITVAITAGLTFDKVGTGASGFSSFVSGNVLVVEGTGASLGQGTYKSASAGVIITTTCIDRDGDTVGLRCFYGLQFRYQPSGGSCTTGGCQEVNGAAGIIEDVVFSESSCEEVCELA